MLYLYTSTSTSTLYTYTCKFYVYIMKWVGRKYTALGVSINLNKYVTILKVMGF